MEPNYNTIDLEYIETKKVSLGIKFVSSILTVIFMIVPMYEFLTQFIPDELYHCYSCLTCYRTFYGFVI